MTTNKSHIHIQITSINLFHQTQTVIILNTGETPVQFTIPDVVFNWFYSQIVFKVHLPGAGAGQYIWRAVQALKEISKMESVSASGSQMVNIPNSKTIEI